MRHQILRTTCRSIRSKYRVAIVPVITLTFLLSNLFFSGATTDLLLPNNDVFISMDFQDVRLKDLLKVFSIQSGLNFIASEAVEDRNITLYLDKVPVKEAMDQLFRANNLSYEYDESSNIIIVKDWGKPQIETVTKVFFLKHATVSTSSLKEELQNYITERAGLEQAGEAGGGAQAGTGGGAGGAAGGKWKVEEEAGITSAIKRLLSEYGNLVEDPRTNSLVITDIPSRFPAIEETIRRLDVSVPQVMLEVEMLDVSKNVVDKMGIKFPTSLVQLDMTRTARATGFPFGNSSKKFNSEVGTMEGTTASSWKVDAWNASHFGPSIFSVINSQLTLDFLRTQTDTKFLARPRLLTLNNETAEIKITTNEAIGIKTSTVSAEGSATTTQEAERQETGVVLRVTPQINPETNEITMFIVPMVSDSAGGGTFTGTAGQSITFKDPELRSTKSTVRVKDGDTVIIGGLIRSNESKTVTQLPILSDIPILGALFRHKDKEPGKERELLVFITPHIIKEGPAELAKTNMPNKEVFSEREQQMTESAVERKKSIEAALNNFER